MFSHSQESPNACKDFIFNEPTFKSGKRGSCCVDRSFLKHRWHLLTYGWGRLGFLTFDIKFPLILVQLHNNYITYAICPGAWRLDLCARSMFVFPANVKTRMSFPIVLWERRDAAVALHEAAAHGEFAGFWLRICVCPLACLRLVVVGGVKCKMPTVVVASSTHGRLEEGGRNK